MTNENTKKWYESKTLWVNCLTIIGGLALWASDSLAAGGTLTVIGAVNVILRIVSDKKLI